MGAVELSLAAESTGPKFHRTVRRDPRQHFLLFDRRCFVFARGRVCSGSARRNYFIRACESRRGFPGSFSSSLRARVSLQLQTESFASAGKSAFNIRGPGGWVGYFFGKTLLLTSMGRVGSIILLSGIYATSLILMTGLRPIHLVRQTVAATRRASRSCTNGDCIASCAKPI